MGQRSDELNQPDYVVRLNPTREPRAYPPPTNSDDAEDSDLAEARDEIEFTRAEMTTTIEAIQDRLDPEVLSEQAKDTAHDVTDYAIREAKEAARQITDHAILQAKEAVRDVTGQASAAMRDATIGRVETMARTATDTAGGLRHTLVETIKANPMPAALVGLGLGWMFMNRPSNAGATPATYRGMYRPGAGATGYAYGETGAWQTGAGYGYPANGSDGDGLGGTLHGAQRRVGAAADQAQHTAGKLMDQVQGTAGQVVDQVQDSASEMVDQVQHTGAHLADQVQEQATHAQSFLQRQLNDNPLLVGAVAVAVGGVLAGTMRPTPREDALLGSARDRVMDTAKEVTQDTMQKVGRVVDEAQQAATHEARTQALVPEA
jgi:hypothetical protein